MRISFQFQLILCALFSAAVSVQAATDKVPVVQTKKVEMVESSETLVYPARIEPKVSASLLAEMDGIVRDLPALGSVVKKGQLVFKIQQLDPIYQYSAAKITAPVNGVVSEVNVTIGTQVSKGQKLGMVVDPSQLRVTVEIPENDLHKISKAGKIEFQSVQLEKNEEIQVEGISPLVSSATGTASANLIFKNKNLHLSAGSLGQVIVTLKGAPAIKVSEQAVVYRGADPFVRIVEGSIAKYKKVVLGSRVAGFIEIKKGLSVNDTLIERASQFVQDNKAVQVEKN